MPLVALLHGAQAPAEAHTDAWLWHRMGRRPDSPAAEQHSATAALDRLRFESKTGPSGVPRSLAPKRHAVSMSRQIVPLVDSAHHSLATARPGLRLADLCPGKVS